MTKSNKLLPMVPIIAWLPLILLLLLSYFTQNNNAYTGQLVDRQTNLPVASNLANPAPLPDGHYTISRYNPGPWGLIVIRHQPGPNRDFVYISTVDVYRQLGWDRSHSTLDLKPGDQFTIFCGQRI